MTIWELEKRVIETISVELQIAPSDVLPCARIISDLGGDYLSIGRVLASLKEQLAVEFEFDSNSELVWDFVKSCHKACFVNVPSTRR